MLAKHCALVASARQNKSVTTISPAVLGRLIGHAWRGNVREIANVMEQAVAVCPGAAIELGHLRATVAKAAKDAAVHVPGATMADIERWAILSTLEATGGATSKAAEMLQISIRKLQYRLQEYNRAPKTNRPGVADPGL